MNKLDPSLIFLYNAKNNLEIVNYEEIFHNIRMINDKCVPTALIKKGWYIDRVRINRNNEIFDNAQKVS